MLVGDMGCVEPGTMFMGTTKPGVGGCCIDPGTSEGSEWPLI
jgi:hypothetical protein